MKLQLLLLAACLSAAAAGIPKKIFNRYIMTKMMEGCFGEKLLSDMSKEMAAASLKCHSQPGPQLPPKMMAHVKLLSKMSNLTCTMREMNMLTADNEVDYVSIKARVTALPLPKEQIDDLQQTMEECREFSSCLPVRDSKSPVMAALGKQMAFFKCFKMAEVESCMRQDFRGDVFPTLMMHGMGLHKNQGLGQILASAMLEEAGDM